MPMRGYTLTEVLLTTVIIAILASMAVPNLRKSVELGYRREAVDLLNTIYTGERTRFFESGDYYFGSGAGAGTLDDADGNDEWRVVFMDDPNLQSIPVDFTVASRNGATTQNFLATARRSAGQVLTLNERRQWCADPVSPPAPPANENPDSCFDAEWVVN